MGIYTTQSLYGINENFLEDIHVEESMYDPGIKGATAIIVENERNFSELMKAVGIDELRYFEESGTEIIYESSRIKGLFTKIKEYFRTAFEKIKGLFKKMMALIDSWIKNDQDFVKKYRNTLLQVDTKGFEYEGYIHTLDKVELKSSADKTLSYLESSGMDSKNVGPHVKNAKKVEDQVNAIEKWRSNKEDHMDKLRGVAAGESSVKLNDKDFKEKLYEKLRNNEKDKVKIGKISVPSLLEIVSSFKDSKKILNDNMKALEKNINDIIKNLNDQEKSLSKDIPGDDKDAIKARATAIRFASEVASAQKSRLNILQIVNGAVMSALKQQNRQAKSMCVRLINYKPKNESFVSEGSSLLNGVTFI